MKKVFLFCAFFLTTSLLFANYTVKIAVYKDQDNLMRFIAKIPEPQYRKNIQIEEKNHLHYVTSISYEYEKEVNKALRAYKKVFPDAFVEEVEEGNAASAPATVDKKVLLTKPSLAKATPVVPVAEPVEAKMLDAKQLLENKTVYLCKDHPLKDAKKEIIKLEFKAKYVLYSKRRRDTPPLQIPYTFDKNAVVLSLSGMQFKYQLLKEEEGFLLAQSYINESKGQQFRFYFDEDLAFEFVHGLPPLVSAKSLDQSQN